MRVRGVIEGFYGPPWSHAERLDLIAFCGRYGLNLWVHAPKDDPFHRKLWREPYPDDELERLAELAGEAGRHGVGFAWAIAPGLSIRAGDESELEALDAKRDQLRSAGVRTVQLLWDDIEPEPVSAEAQAEISNSFARGEPLVVCPMGYAGTARTPYRDAFGSLLDPQIVVYWTGAEVVPQAISRQDLDDAADALDHELLLWDNYPVNDFDTERLFLGPLRGRDARLADGRLAGIVANGMLQAVPSKLALATVAEWAREPAAYDPVASYERALREHGTEVVEALRRLGPSGTWPGSDPGHVRPDDVAALIEALAPGVDAATGLALLEPFA
ncbi:MAG: protein O-GlcNAcase [Actinomycetota bacterium]|nr:protein O-GlcNAcase [Actinomycetota bacterium]